MLITANQYLVQKSPFRVSARRRSNAAITCVFPIALVDKQSSNIRRIKSYIWCRFCRSVGAPLKQAFAYGDNPLQNNA